MSLQITQESFDNTVRENVSEFEMSVEEAIKETIEQFSAQGVNLTHIVTDWMMASSANSLELVDAIRQLNELTSGESMDLQALITQLSIIRAECDKGLNYKVLAGREGAYNVIMTVLCNYDSDVNIVKECLSTLISLMTQNSDLLDDNGIQAMVTLLDTQKDLDVLKLVLIWMKECCVLHEMNRQQIFAADVLSHLKSALHDPNSAVLQEVLGVLRALVLDDDPRLEFGRAHEHARAIASDTLCAITNLLEKFKHDSAVINDLLLTLSALLVRTEFCKKVEDAGGIQIIHDAMNNFQDNDKIVKQCLKVLKALAGNDECKTHIIQRGIAPDIVMLMQQHQKTAQTIIFGLACIAALSLRSPDNSKALFEAGAPDIIIHVMRIHPDNESLQKNGSWAIRNMVSRSRYQSQKFLELNAEEVLKAAAKKFKKSEYDMKAALRDLGCDVELREEWTGKGGKLNTQDKK
ncbi:hypothetical protein MML48_2g00002134 [Holotrichia oblita]|uniref:Uncharacterized protein n=1 Tax=Holotrichia oblita TaxID=644536 RepID=A0ACB9TJ80_HOLOL|nr:hypothetical protein MML48_2g00002134 [Holotrichia oblita]